MIKVLYDGKCGLCNKEISYYKKIANNKNFKWLDIANNPKDLKEYNIKLSDALLYLHAFDSENQKYIGVDAFILIWKNLNRAVTFVSCNNLDNLYVFLRIRTDFSLINFKHL